MLTAEQHATVLMCPAVNNAGRNIRKATVDITAEDYHTIMSTNLESAFALCQVWTMVLIESVLDKIFWLL